MSNSVLKLVNPEFTIEFMGKEYRIRKATLDKAIQYQQKLKELQNEASADPKIVAYCVYIMLKDQIADLTEEMTLANVPADVNTLEILTMLGFINPSNLEKAKQIEEAILNKSTSENSSSQ